MKTFQLFLTVSLASMLCTFTPTHAETLIDDQDTATQNAIKQQRLETVACELASLSKIVELPLLTHAQKTNYLHLLHGCTSKLKDLSKTIDVNQDQKLLATELFFEYCKKAYLKMQLLTVGLDECSHAFLDTSLDQRSYHQALATIHLELYQWLEAQWRTTENLEALNNQEITEIVHHVLRNYLSESFYSPFFSNNQSNKLMRALDVDLYDDYSTMAEEYLTCVQTYKNHTYADALTAQAQVMQHLDNLIFSFQKEHASAPSQPVEVVFNFFVAKLFCCKQKISFNQQLHEVNKLHPTLINVFIKHHRLIQSDEFTTSYKSANSTNRQLLDRYIVLVEHFFMTPLFQSLLFVSDVDTMIAGFKNIKPTNRWSHDAIECMKGALSCAKELLNHAQVTLGLKKQKADQVKIINEPTHIFDEMQEVLTSIYDHITKKTEQTGSSWTDILNYIRSGQWIMGSSIKNVTQNDEGNFALELANQALANPKFTDAKSAALQALVYASPFLLTKIIEYVKPHLGKKLGTHIDALIDGKNDGLASNHDKIIEFANNNPEVLKLINQNHPEIIDLIAESLKNLSQKP